MKMNTNQLKAIAASYGRSVLAGGLALYMAGVTDPKDLWTALLAALVPVALRAVNPNDPAYGRVPSVAEVEKAVQASVVETVAKKKAAPKKKAASAVKKTK